MTPETAVQCVITDFGSEGILNTDVHVSWATSGAHTFLTLFRKMELKMK